MFLMLSIAETITGVNEGSSSGKSFSLFLLRVLSLPSRSDELISPDVFDGITSVMVSAILINFKFCK